MRNAMPLGNRRLITIEQTHQIDDQSKVILDCTVHDLPFSRLRRIRPLTGGSKPPIRRHCRIKQPITDDRLLVPSQWVYRADQQLPKFRINGIIHLRLLRRGPF